MQVIEGMTFEGQSAGLRNRAARAASRAASALLHTVHSTECGAHFAFGLLRKEGKLLAPRKCVSSWVTLRKGMRKGTAKGYPARS